jgi:hypothetical protein
MRKDIVGKLFVKVITNGDLPKNPVCVRECVICGGVFTRSEYLAHEILPLWADTNATTTTCKPIQRGSLGAVAGQGRCLYDGQRIS